MKCAICKKPLYFDGCSFEYTEWRWVVFCSCTIPHVDLKGLGDTKKEALSDYRMHEAAFLRWVKSWCSSI